MGPPRKRPGFSRSGAVSAPGSSASIDAESPATATGSWIPRTLRRRLTSSPHRARLDAFVRRAAASLPDGARVLDAGSGDAPYRHHFSHCLYESADFHRVAKPYATPTYECDLAALPVEDSRFDLVLATQVLEHLAEPDAVLRELRRVLRPGGTLWLTAPLRHEVHEAPYDFYRFTGFGLRHLVEKAGFRIRELEWTEGAFATIGYDLALAAENTPLDPRSYGGGAVGWLMVALAVPLRGFLVGASALFGWLELRHLLVSGSHCKNYSLVAEKPLSGPGATPPPRPSPPDERVPSGSS